MKQIVRANRGGRRPRNQAEQAVGSAERLYLERMLCGHLEEAGNAFRHIWTNRRLRRHLRRQLLRLPSNAQDQAELALGLLEREFVRQPSEGVRQRFLNPVRNAWAFHYLDHAFRTALAQSQAAGDDCRILIAQVRGLSRYLVIDEFIERALLATVQGDAKDYDANVRSAIELAGTLGKVVDALLIGLLREPGLEFQQRVFTMTLEGPLAKSYREALRRRLVQRPGAAGA